MAHNPLHLGNGGVELPGGGNTNTFNILGGGGGLLDVKGGNGFNFQRGGGGGVFDTLGGGGGVGDIKNGGGLDFGGEPLGQQGGFDFNAFAQQQRNAFSSQQAQLSSSNQQQIVEQLAAQGQLTPAALELLNRRSQRGLAGGLQQFNASLGLQGLQESQFGRDLAQQESQFGRGLEQNQGQFDASQAQQQGQFEQGLGQQQGQFDATQLFNVFQNLSDSDLEFDDFLQFMRDNFPDIDFGNLSEEGQNRPSDEFVDALLGQSL